MATPEVAFVADLSKEADKQVAALQRQLKDAQRIQRFLAAFSEALDAGHPSEAVRVLTSHKKQLELLAERDADTANRVQSLGSDIRAQVEDGFQDLPRDFPLAIQKAGLALDPSSRHPNYSILEPVARTSGVVRGCRSVRAWARGGRMLSRGVQLRR